MEVGKGDIGRCYWGVEEDVRGYGGAEEVEAAWTGEGNV